MLSKVNMAIKPIVNGASWISREQVTICANYSSSQFRKHLRLLGHFKTLKIPPIKDFATEMADTSSTLKLNKKNLNLLVYLCIYVFILYCQF